MNLLIAIFLYHGLTYPGDNITKQEVLDHRIEIEETKNDPEFLDLYRQGAFNPTVVTVDADAME